MVRDAEATRARLLQAATAEFATYGVAGARVDRIAAAASANKNLIYIYFGNKEQLLDAVFNHHLARLLDAVPFDATDLPGYAGKLFDFTVAHPELARLIRWYSLEKTGHVSRFPLAVSSTAAKLQALATAQHEGRIDDGLPPEHLLTLILALANAWSEGNPDALSQADDVGGVAARRHAVIVGVRRLIRPPQVS